MGVMCMPSNSFLFPTIIQPVAPVSMSSLFSSSVQQSNSWSSNDAKDQVSSWGNSDSVSGTVTSNGPSVTSAREQSSDNTPFAPERYDNNCEMVQKNALY